MRTTIFDKWRRVVPAPPASQPGLPVPILNVECAEDEEIEWQWTETAVGRYVSGYRLKRKTLRPENP